MTESDQVTFYMTGASKTIDDGVGVVFVDPAAIMTTGQIILPPNPYDGQRVRIVPGGTILAGTVVTLLTVLGNAGQGIMGANTGIFTCGSSMVFMYRTSNAKWYRLQ